MKHLLQLAALLLWLAVPSLKAENYPYRTDVLWTVVADHADWLYKTGERPELEIIFQKYGIPRDAEVTVETGVELLGDKKKTTVKLNRGRAKVKLDALKQPGFLDCQLSARVDGKNYKHHVKVGFSPEKLQPHAQNPADFDSWWADVVKDARRQPVDFTIRKVEEKSTREMDTYLIRLKTDRQGHTIYGYLSRPTAPGRYPVVLCPPGAGVKTIKPTHRPALYAKNGMVRLEIEIHGLNPEMSEEDFKAVSAAFNNRTGGYIQQGMDHRDDAYLKHVYAACVRAIDYLVTLDCWDGKNIIVQGGSQGGALALITAALDQRVTLCVANHPALSDMAASLAGRTDGYPHFRQMGYELTPDRVKNLAYFDVVNFARRITCPVYLTWGFNDNTCPPTTSYTVWNLLTCEKESLITPINEHWVSTDTDELQVEWIKMRLK